MRVMTYLMQQGTRRIAEFMVHWYRDAFRRLTHAAISLLERFDRVFNVRINAAYLFQPLYSDHSIIGHIIGFLFRSAQVVIGGILYVIIILFTAALYIVWALIPPYIVLQIIMKAVSV